MGILKEARENGLQVEDLPPKVPCTVFEDNSGALELARLPKMRPRTKHINQAFHHFREHVEHKDIIMNATPTDDQMADILTKPLTKWRTFSPSRCPKLPLKNTASQSWDGREHAGDGRECSYSAKSK